MSPAQQTANIANAQHSTGPRTEAGKAASSQNATKTGLFSTRDFIRPNEECRYAELRESLHRELAPVGAFECSLADEIRRAMWRFHRCAETEGSMIEPCLAAVNGPDMPIPDALQIEATAKLQVAVDRARSQAHRLLHRCAAELRKLQTERHFRNEALAGKGDYSFMGLADLRVIRKAHAESGVEDQRQYYFNGQKNEDNMESEIEREMGVPQEWRDLQSALATPVTKETPVTKQTREQVPTSRNARCNCGSGLKFKRCCALKAAA